MKTEQRQAGKAWRWWSRLFEPVDIAALVFFRVSFGALLLWETYRYFDKGWIKRYYIDPSFHFTYYGFDWIRPWPGDGMYYHFIALGLLSTCILLGLAYRVATALFFLTFTYVFLLDQTRYLNHFYLISLISFLLIFVPAHRAFSLDAWRNPVLRSDVAPRWALWLLRAQFTLVYVYGGIAKINGDWLRGEPLRTWLARDSHLPLIGRFLTEEWMVMLFASGGLFFDLFAVPLLLWPRTRYFALAWAAAFHLLNANLFRIGIFPFFALAGTLLFLPPDWPRKIMAWLARRTTPSSRKKEEARFHYSKPVTIVLMTFLVLQVLVPLRHFVYPGNVSWTEEGHRFAWHMKLRTKQGTARFLAYDRLTGRRRVIKPRKYLNRDQARTMSTHPDMVLQFAHFLAGELRKEGWRGVEIRARVKASLNGRDPQPLIDPGVNIAEEKRNLLPASWIVPLQQPLPGRRNNGEPARANS